MTRIPVAFTLALGLWLGARPGGPPPASKTRNYYVAADEVTWNYMPHGTNDITGQPFDAVEKRFVEAAKDHPALRERLAHGGRWAEMAESAEVEGES